MNIKSIFPQIENRTYLNTAACGLMSKPVLDFKLKDLEKLFLVSSDYFTNENEIIQRTKTKISTIFNADVDRVGITPNFSLAFNAVLDGLPSKTSFLCLDEDYLSVTMPIKTRGFSYHSLPITSDVESDIYNYVKLHKPDVLALSLVQYLSGIKIEIEFFKQLKKDFPQLKILVDATQYLGTEDFDFKNSGIDLLVASCYKWLNAGFGNAIVLLSDELYQNLVPKQVGANSFYDKAKLEQNPMGFLEPGHFDLNTVGALEIALDHHYNKMGIKAIEKKIKLLSNKVLEALSELGLIDNNVIDRNSHSSIFMLNLNQNRFIDFQNADVILSKRGTGLRISLHYYNTFDDFEHLLKVINH